MSKKANQKDLQVRCTAWMRNSQSSDEQPQLLSAPKRLQGMLMTLQNYCLKVVYKPGQEMFISDMLSRATTEGTCRGTAYQRHTVCSLQQEQDDMQYINQADFLNVSDQRLEQIRKHTEWDESLQTLKQFWRAGQSTSHR